MHTYFCRLGCGAQHRFQVQTMLFNLLLRLVKSFALFVSLLNTNIHEIITFIKTKVEPAKVAAPSTMWPSTGRLRVETANACNRRMLIRPFPVLYIKCMFTRQASLCQFRGRRDMN